MTCGRAAAEDIPAPTPRASSATSVSRGPCSPAPTSSNFSTKSAPSTSLSTEPLASTVSTVFPSSPSPSPSPALLPLPQSPPSLPSPPNPPSPSAIHESRLALDAALISIGTSHAAPLQSRAHTLHANAGALSAQQAQLEHNTAALRRENQKLSQVLAQGLDLLKNLGDVGNWAGLVERDLNVVQETLRVVREDDLGERERDEGDGWITDSEDGNLSDGKGREDTLDDHALRIGHV